ncbi:MAG: queuosine salvage family protein, partial [Geminicoccales bacterium]
MLVLDALNFCFWPLPGSAGPRWSVTYRGVTHNGYLALAAALRRAVERGVPLADQEYLSSLDLP